MMKRSRGEIMQQKKLQEDTPTKTQRRYKSPKRTHNAPKTRTEDESPTTVPVDTFVESTCTENSEVHTENENPLFAVWDELGSVWPWAVEQEELSGWYPFVEGHFREIGEEEGVDLINLWRLDDIIEVPN